MEKLVWTRGFGVKDSASGEPVDNNTLFEAASVSKTVFAYVALRLCEAGVIGPDSVRRSRVTLQSASLQTTSDSTSSLRATCFRMRGDFKTSARRYLCYPS